MRLLANFDKAVSEVLAEKVKARLTFKVRLYKPPTPPYNFLVLLHSAYIYIQHILTAISQGHLDTYRFCDDVWTFIIKDINFKLDNTNTIHADRVKIVSCNTKRPGEV